mmetsp:Transcript_17701/g.48186  ORF Transcript_17701/g.48186 Transcript_17701/m.48186 type:complete len:142 (-) Transcript_17701:62-487(-)
MSTARSRVFAAYRKAFRARKEVFSRDALAMRESRKTIREEFGKNRHIAIADATQLEGLLSMVDEAVDFLKHGVMQAERNPQSGNFVAKVTPDHMQDIEHANVEVITPESATRLSEPPAVDSTCKSGTTAEKPIVVESSKSS